MGEMEMKQKETNYTGILELALETAGRLGIRVKDPALILKNMKPKIGITTILSNEDYTLWVDKHYIAYNEKAKAEVVYIFADQEHINEELRSVISRIKADKNSRAVKTLLSVKEQLLTASAAMNKSGDGFYLFEDGGRSFEGQA
jgi:hypothetical protein